MRVKKFHGCYSSRLWISILKMIEACTIIKIPNTAKKMIKGLVFTFYSNTTNSDKNTLFGTFLIKIRQKEQGL